MTSPPHAVSQTDKEELKRFLESEKYQYGVALSRCSRSGQNV